MIWRVSSVSGNVGQEEHRQGVGQVAHVADGAHVHAGGQRHGGQDDDADERRGDRAEDQRHEIDDREAGRDHDVGEPGHADEFGDLRHEDEDRQRVDEAGHHRARDEAHDAREAEQAGGDLEEAGEDGGREQVLQPVIAHQRHHQHGGGGGGGRDHARPPAGERDQDRDGERGVEADLGVDARDDRKRDGLGDQRQRHHQPGQKIGADVAEPFVPERGEVEHGDSFVRVRIGAVGERRGSGLPGRSSQPAMGRSVRPSIAVMEAWSTREPMVSC